MGDDELSQEHPSRERRRRLVFAGLVAVALLAPAAYFARTHAGLNVPYDVDLYRDAAQAEMVRRGHLFDDWGYAGEVVWYNPLGSWVVAALASITGIPVLRIVTISGIAINLLTPVALVVLVTRWFGRICAAFTLVGYMFVLCGGFPPWAVATYTPWLFQSIPAQGLFFVALIALPPAFESDRWRFPLALGALLGLCALAHTTPALLLAVLVAATAIDAARRGRIAAAAALQRALVVFATGAAVSLPFWGPIAWHYRFRVVNPQPTDFVWDRLEPDAIARLIWDYVARWPMLVALAGVVVLCWPGRTRASRHGGLWILTAWTITATVLLTVSVVGQSSLPGAALVPAVVPAHHYFLYVTAAACVWFGLGMTAVTGTIASVLPTRTWTSVAVAVGLAVGMVAVALPGWRSRDDRLAARETSRSIDATFDRFALSSWIATSTPPDAIVLYDYPDDPGFMTNALDGRRTVSVDNPFFSSPYVRWEPRFEDGRQMIDVLAACDMAKFAALDEPYGVDFVVVDTNSRLRDRDGVCDALVTVYETPVGAIYAIG